ncbi:MAG: cytochrome c-type biogenesis protein CcmH [Cellvibrionaceae bacterium]|nr:cytochrome c-type biogenesis protein CcmH [Cellvibrionaceae bacterium]
MHKLLLILWLLLMLPYQAMAAIDVYDFPTDDQRKRYQKFLEELRCPKCKNNNLAGTNSEIADDLRRELHKMVLEGKTDAEIIDFMVSRYGDFVLYRPPVQGNTIVLWLGPLVFLVIGLGTVGWIVLRRRRLLTAEPGLTEDEQKQLAAILEAEKADLQKSKN